MFPTIEAGSVFAMGRVLPEGWDENRVQDVIAHYDNQSEDEESAEIEAEMEGEDTTLMAVPTELVPQVRAILARHQTG